MHATKQKNTEIQKQNEINSATQRAHKHSKKICKQISHKQLDKQY